MLAARRTDLYLHTNKTEFMCFKQGAISHLYRKPLKSVDQFTYLASNISSTESDVNIHRIRKWTAIVRLSIVSKSDLSDKIKQDIFQAAVVSLLLYGCTTSTLTKHMGKKAWWKLHKHTMYCIKQILEATLHKTVAVWPLTSNLTSHLAHK